MKSQQGVTLIELIVFIVIVSISLVTLVRVFNQSVVNSVDPVTRVRALELAQAQLDEILSRKFDENTPPGGIPACGTSGGLACLGIIGDTDFDDVGDYNGQSFGSAPYTIAVTVIEAGTEIGLASNDLARKITVTVDIPGGDALVLAAYKTNF